MDVNMNQIFKCNDRDDLELEKRIDRLRELKLEQENENEKQKEKEKEINNHQIKYESQKNIRAIYLDKIPKNSQYTHDYDGNIIMIKNPLRVPNPVVLSSCNFGVTMPSFNQNYNSTIKSNNIKNDQSSLMIKKVGMNNQCEKLYNIQHSNFEIISPSTGVKITENGKTKSYIPNPLNSLTHSRSEFLTCDKNLTNPLSINNFKTKEVHMPKEIEENKPTFRIKSNSIYNFRMGNIKQKLPVNQGYISYASKEIKETFNKKEEDSFGMFRVEASHIPYHYKNRNSQHFKLETQNNELEEYEFLNFKNQNRDASSNYFQKANDQYKKLDKNNKNSFKTPNSIKTKKDVLFLSGKGRLNPIERRKIYNKNE